MFLYIRTYTSCDIVMAGSNREVFAAKYNQYSIENIYVKEPMNVSYAKPNTSLE